MKLDPLFQAIAYKRMSELTPEERDDAYEDWLRANHGRATDDGNMLFLLRRCEARLNELRALRPLADKRAHAVALASAEGAALVAARRKLQRESEACVPALPYWPYCPECQLPFAFERDEPFAHCGCGTTEWGHPRPADYVRPPPTPVLAEVGAERARQDGKWGGAAHDDKHSVAEFVQFIEDYAGWARMMDSLGSPLKARRRLMQVAAMAVAVVESLDRKTARPAGAEADPHGAGPCKHCEERGQ